MASAETPDLFPGLTAADRAKLARLAEVMETVPEVVNRMNGYLLDLSKQRPLTPAIVDSFPIGGRERQPLGIDTAVPLRVDNHGRLITALPRRRVETDTTVSIPGNGTVSQWVNVTEVALDHANIITLWDDRSRLAAEVISIDGSWKYDQPDPAAASPDAYQLQANILAATVGVVGSATTNINSARWIRLRSAVPVAAAGRSFRFVAVSQ